MLTTRVKALEDKMGTIESASIEACKKSKEAADNSNEILDFLQTARKYRKHLRTAIGFGTGLLVAGNIGDPAIWNFIRSFFSGSADCRF